MKKRVLIYAYLEENLGDDLMVWLLCKRYPHIRFEVLTHGVYKEIFKDLNNLTVYGFEDRRVTWCNKILDVIKHGTEDFFRRRVRKADAVVHIGGSVYIQHDTYPVSLMIDRTLRDTSRKMYVCGANFGPYKDESYYQEYHQLLSRYDGVCFRDQYSYGLFRDLPNVRYAPDVVFNYEMYEKERAVEEKKQVLFSVIQTKTRNGAFAIDSYTEDYQAFMAKLAEKYIDKGYRVVIVSFCKAQHDVEASAEILEKVEKTKKEQIRTYVYDRNREEILHLFKESEVVVGTRFHSIILGWLAGKKVLPVVYDQKTMHTLEDNHIQTYVTLGQIKDVDLDDLISRVQKIGEKQREQLIHDAQMQFADLDREFL